MREGKEDSGERGGGRQTYMQRERERQTEIETEGGRERESHKLLKFF